MTRRSLVKVPRKTLGATAPSPAPSPGGKSLSQTPCVLLACLRVNGCVHVRVRLLCELQSDNSGKYVCVCVCACVCACVCVRACVYVYASVHLPATH
jgi:hypothetical protein